MGSDLVLSGPTFTLTPKNLSEAMKYAELIAESGICPQAYRGKPGDVLVAVQMGAEVGLSPLQAIQNIAVIDNRPTIWGDAVLAIVRRSGLLELFEERDPSDALTKKEGFCRVKRRGAAEVIERRFTIDDANRAGLIKRSGEKGAWATYPGRMLQMRARSWALRDGFTDVLKGLYFREEAEDYQVVATTPEGHEVMMPRSKSVPAPSPSSPSNGVHETKPEAPAADSKPDIDAFLAKQKGGGGTGQTNGGNGDAPPKCKMGMGRAFRVLGVETFPSRKDGVNDRHGIALESADGNQCAPSTFDVKIADFARAHVGKPVLAELTSREKDGKTYLNIVAIEERKAGSLEPAAATVAPREDIPFNHREPGEDG